MVLHGSVEITGCRPRSVHGRIHRGPEHIHQAECVRSPVLQPQAFARIRASLPHSPHPAVRPTLQSLTTRSAEPHMNHIKLSLGILIAGLASGGLLAGSVNINSADAATIAGELKGIGPAKAAAIVEYRQKHGQFRSVDELAQVKGVNQKLIDRNRNDLRLSGAPSAPSQTMVVTAAKPTAQPVVKGGSAKTATRATTLAPVRK